MHVSITYPEGKAPESTVALVEQDTWNMDVTLARIIHPMLVQFKANGHGYPAEITDEAWQEILDEMIWAFGVWGTDAKYELALADLKRAERAFHYFGVYYMHLWD